MRTGIVLSGGKSSRLGQDKGLVELEGRPLVSWVIDILSGVVDEIVVVVGSEETIPWYWEVIPNDVRVVSDCYSEDSPLIGLITGLREARGDYAVVCACDMPFIDPVILELLFCVSYGLNGALLQKPNGWIEPLPSVYHVANCLENAERMRVRLMEPPALLLEPRAELPLRAVLITPADRISLPKEQTRDLDLERMRQILEREEETGITAYLIVQGGRTFDLTQPTIRLGRALDNDLILEDLRVSRYHAQLRHRYGRYILQDLGSSGGTSVNGFPVQEIVLRPGDVISLSGIDLIYAEEKSGRPASSGNTPAYTPVKDERG